jgi:hypothetical protein
MRPPRPRPDLVIPLPAFDCSPSLLLSLLSAPPPPPLMPQLPAGLRARADLSWRRQWRAERQSRGFLSAEDLLAASCSARTTSWQQLLGAQSSTSWRRLAARGGGAWRIITPTACLFSPAAAPEAEQDGPRDPIAFSILYQGPDYFQFLSRTRLLFIFIWHGSSHTGYQIR